MRRSLLPLLGVLLLVGCGGRSVPVVQEPEPPPRPQPVDPAPQPPEPNKQERYDDAMLEAYTHLAAGKYAEALTALEAARAIDKTDQVQREIDRVRALLDQQAGAARAIADIRAVLQDGKPDEAARLAGQALILYGASESAAELAQLKRQADALVAAQGNEPAADQAARLRREVETALKPDENNLRAAVVALEQLDAVDTAPEVDQQLTALRQRLTAYDAARRRAQEYRADPGTLEEALEQLLAAAQAWDTFQVRAEIDECSRALALRKPRLAVADFDVRGEIGLPDAGKTIAEELLPTFKAKFDLVERGQLVKVLEELKLDAEDAGGDDAARKELARLGKVRYLVVGSLSHLGGLAVNARVIDLQTGLIVQTGRLLADSGADLRQKLPQLGAVLQMSDDEKLAFEARQQQEAQALQPIAAAQVVPPAPEPLPQGQAPPPPIVTITVVAPKLGQVTLDDLDRLPGVPVEPAPPVIVPDQEEMIRDRLLHLMLEVGDNHFRRGDFANACRCFDLAVALGGGRPEILLRLDRCRPFLPPGFVLVPPRPRVAVLPFCTLGRVPPGLEYWVADALACYLPPDFHVVPRGELFWFMGRLGLTIGDVVHNPSARRWLARALGVRYFIVGSIRETASFDVSAHLLDAEFGWEVARSRVHVHNVAHLKLRLPELVRRLFLTPAERARLQAEAEAARLQVARLERMAEEARLAEARASRNYQVLVIEARRLGGLGQLAAALELLLGAQQLRPDSIEVGVLLHQFRDQQRHRDVHDHWRDRTVAQRAAFEEMQRRQADLTRAVEEARQRAEREAAGRADAEKRARLAERDKAHLDFLARAEKALRDQRFDLAISLFRDALDLKQSDAAVQGLATARAARDKAAQEADAKERKRKDDLLAEQRKQDLAKLQVQIEADRKRREQQEQALREAQVVRDKAAFAKLLDEARDALKKNQAEPAITALQTARRLRPTQANEVEPIWNEALALQNKLALDKLEATKRAEIVKQQEAEKLAREKAEQDAKAKRVQFDALVVEARNATIDGKYAVAVEKYEAALKLFRTDDAVLGLTKAKDALAREKTRQDDAARLAGEIKKMRDDGLKAFDAKDYAKAKLLLADFNKRSPGDVQVLAALGQAEQLLAKLQADARRDEERKQRDAEFARLFAGAKANYDAKQYAAAVVALRDAVKLKPDDKPAADLLALAEKAQTNVTEAEKAKLAQFQKLVSDGRAYLGTKQYDKADAAFGEAKKLFPQDKILDGLLADLKKARDDDTARIKAETARREEEQRKAKLVADALTAARLALSRKDLEAAGKAIDAAAKVLPDNAEVKRAQLDLKRAQDDAKVEADARKRRQDQVAALVTKARDALKAEKPDDALKHLAEAGELVPDDATVKTLRNQANLAIQAKLKGRIDGLVTDARKAMAAKDLPKATQLLREARQLGPTDAGVTAALADLDKLAKEPAPNRNQADYKLAMDAGKAAFDRKNYAGAVNAYKEALRLISGDREATTRLAEAQRMLTEGNVKTALDQAQAALTAKKYDDALKAVNQALALAPGNRDALKLVSDVNKAKADADDAQKKAQFTQLVTQAKAALAAKKFADALPLLDQAGKLFPADREVPTLVKQARDGLATPMPNPMADFQKHMDNGATLERQKKFAEAAAAYNEALKAKPNDVLAKVALQRVQTAQAIATHLAAGNAALTAKKWDVAEKAFNEALKLDPRNADAKEGVTRAKAMR